MLTIGVQSDNHIKAGIVGELDPFFEGERLAVVAPKAEYLRPGLLAISAVLSEEPSSVTITLSTYPSSPAPHCRCSPPRYRLE